VQIDSDVEIDINVILVGKVIIESGAKIGANCYIKDSTIGAGVIIEPNSVIDGAIIEQQAKIGPFARIRPNSHIKSYAKIGNFVEIKSSVVGMYSKVNHLSYIGNGNIGQKVNVGAGVITCNYDGLNKHITVIEDNVSVGAGCQLIAPIVIEKSATVAAGTTLLKDAPADLLTLNKKMQYSIEWQRPIKINDKSETYKNQFIIEK
ncbi:MAG: DapH/DapD/GlmU-related protein, partial [Gammaproteobacteria bacterium]